MSVYRLMVMSLLFGLIVATQCSFVCAGELTRWLPIWVTRLLWSASTPVSTPPTSSLATSHAVDALLREAALFGTYTRSQCRDLVSDYAYANATRMCDALMYYQEKFPALARESVELRRDSAAIRACKAGLPEMGSQLHELTDKIDQCNAGIRGINERLETCNANAAACNRNLKRGLKDMKRALRHQLEETIRLMKEDITRREQREEELMEKLRVMEQNRQAMEDKLLVRIALHGTSYLEPGFPASIVLAFLSMLSNFVFLHGWKNRSKAKANAIEHFTIMLVVLLGLWLAGSWTFGTLLSGVWTVFWFPLAMCVSVGLTLWQWQGSAQDAANGTNQTLQSLVDLLSSTTLFNLSKAKVDPTPVLARPAVVLGYPGHSQEGQPGLLGPSTTNDIDKRFEEVEEGGF